LLVLDQKEAGGDKARHEADEEAEGEDAEGQEADE
jgi:hypothetical protein